MKPFSCYLLLFFLGLGNLFGEGTLILFPDVSLLRILLEALQYSPFQSYLIPGIILFVGLGVYPAFTAIFHITEKPMKAFDTISIYKKTHWSWNSSLYIGFIPIIWITIEVYMLRSIGFIHVFYIFLGLAIQAVTVLPSVRRHYS